jgi:hypothetical protein
MTTARHEIDLTAAALRAHKPLAPLDHVDLRAVAGGPQMTKRVGVALRLQRLNNVVRSSNGPGQFMLWEIAQLTLPKAWDDNHIELSSPA